MGISVHKTLFANLLRAYQRRAGVRQYALAASIGISPSAMSQMLSGRLVPNANQLETIGAQLHLELNELAELRDHLARIRSGGGETSSVINDFIRSARLRCGYSIEELADATGIAAADLSDMETRLGARPTPAEAIRLGAVLNINLDELCHAIPGEALPPLPASNASSSAPRSELLHDHTVPYRPFSTVSRAPLLRGSALLAYEPGTDFPMDYCWRHMDMLVESPVPGIAIVRMAGREAGLMPNLFLELEVVPGGACGSGMLVLAMSERQLLIGEMAGDGKVRALDGKLRVCRFAWPVRQFRGEPLPQVAIEQMQNWNSGGNR